MEEQTIPYRTYWIIWGLLLVLTLAMMAIEAAPFPRVLGVLVLLIAMFVKAGFIVAWFMHLKFERVALQMTIVLATVLTVIFLFGLLVPDGIRMLQLAQ